MLIIKIIYFWDDTKEKFTTQYLEIDFLMELVGDNVFNYKDLRNKMYGLAVTVHNVLFRQDLISNISFPENLIFEEDIFFKKPYLMPMKFYFTINLFIFIG